jgi:ABC-2 type transport system ATP-binding protein
VLELADDGSLEVVVTKDQNLNGIFAALSERGIEVVSMRNKANRLEELFMRLVEGRDAGTGLPNKAASA